MALMDYVFELEAKNEEDRREALLKILEQNSCEYELENFNFDGQKGTNVILEIGNGKKEILLISHYDAYTGSPGANGNASSIAVSMDVYRRLSEYKKRGMLNCKVKIIFFDKEESSLLFPKGKAGSKAYLQTHEHEFENAIAIFNLTLSGSGDSISVWPVNDSHKENKTLDIMEKVFDKLKVEHEKMGKMPFCSSYETFKSLGEIFCLTAIRKQDKDNLRLYAEAFPIELAVRNLLGTFSRKFRIDIPELLSHYHNTEDKSSHLNEYALRMMSDATFNIIINLDRKFGRSIEEF
ncbi:MAG: M28 family peptidase [Nanoarchaeota archaeon]|nr:M28 family peptidase [Nanoarchaeota archaeon]